GGAGIARSYLGLPEKTNEKFISDPFTNKTKTRIYKTGDLAKFLPDSNIEFIGRIDNQVKIRGYRVELAEIEATLSKNEKIRECAIIVNKDIRGSKKLVAYYVLETGVTADKTELYHFLKEILPYYMLPSSFVELDELPYTSSMKIDRKSLPVPEEISYHPASFAPPETKTEKQLAAIWQDVLNLKAISINESFFEIGGDSLLAIEAISKIREKIKVQIQLKNLFEFPSIKELADWIKKYNETKNKARNFFTKSKQIPINIINLLKNRKEPHSYLVSLQSQGTQVPFIMVYGDASVKYLPGFLGKDQPFYSFISQGTDGERIICKRVEDIARLYLNELLSIFPESPYRLCGHSFGGVVAYEMAQQLIAKGKDVSFLSLIDTATPKLDLMLIDKVSFRRKLLKFEYRVKRRLYSTFGLTIPNKYRNLYILDSFLKAQKYYKPALYTGDVFIFRSTKSRIKERDIGWRKYIKGKLTIIDIPGDHLTIIREPKTIKILAKEILACLRKSKQTKT
ncbi:MAG: AMP-binding protein, partial [Bacteroidales bacterium]|nr:AMP-binding protein [Bacteroidales bacterium]